MTRPTPTGQSAQPPDSNGQVYDLGIDEQVEKFLELRQKLSYFLITASIVVIAFTINFYIKTIRVDKALNHHAHVVLLAAAAVSALAASGLALLNLQFGHVSFSRHLRYRYARRSYTELTRSEQRHWELVNRTAAYALVMAFAALFLEILLLLLFFWPIFV